MTVTLVGARPDAGIEQTIVLVASAGVMFWNASHFFWIGPFAVLFFLASSPPFTHRLRPAFWLLAVAVWTPVALLAWKDMEDHVYLGIYWMVALAICISGENFWSDARLQARVLIGLTFAASVAWKLSAPEFLDGRTFVTLFVGDERFSPLAQSLGGWTSAGLADAGAAFRSVAETDPGVSVRFVSGSRSTLLAQAMVLWTIGMESVTAASFLAPDHWRLANARPYALLAFGWSTYLLVPVAGFALLLMTLGGVVAHGDHRWQRRYVASGVIFILVAYANIVGVI